MSRLFFKQATGAAGHWTSFQIFAHVQPMLRSAPPASTIARRAVSGMRSAAPSFRFTAARPRLAAQPLTKTGPMRFNSSSSPSEKVRRATEKLKDKADEGKDTALTLGQRLKKLSKEYGWVALGVYLGISALDFPLCFVLVRVAGEERIGHLEHVVVSAVSKAIPESVKTGYYDLKAKFSKSGDTTEPKADDSKGASLGTQIALAYALHKSLIFIRVPLTAAVTPKVVQILRGWGYQIGKKVVKN